MPWSCGPMIGLTLVPLLALSYLLHITVVVFNSRDAQIEVITSGQGNVAHNQVATLHFREGHYDAMRPMTQRGIQAALG